MKFYYLLFLFVFFSCTATRILKPDHKGSGKIIKIEHKKHSYITDKNTFSKYFELAAFDDFFSDGNLNDTLKFNLDTLYILADSNYNYNKGDKDAFGELLKSENYIALDSNMQRVEKIKLRKNRLRKTIHQQNGWDDYYNAKTGFPLYHVTVFDKIIIKY